MDARQLSYFISVLEEGGVTAAAQKLGLSQPALTKAMKALEKELHVVLFDRSFDGVSPTIYGEALYGRAKAILSELRKAREDIGLLRGIGKERLAIGATPSFTLSILPHAISEVAARFPAVSFHVQVAQSKPLLTALHSRQIDLCLTNAWDHGLDPRFSQHTLFEDRIGVIASTSHPLAGRSTIFPRDLLEFPWTYTPDAGSNGPALIEFFNRADLEPPTPQIDTGGYLSMVKTLVTNSHYLTLGPAHAILSELESGKLTFLPVEGMPQTIRMVTLVRKETEMGQSARTLLAAVTRWSKQLSAETSRVRQ